MDPMSHCDRMAKNGPREAIRRKIQSDVIRRFCNRNTGGRTARLLLVISRAGQGELLRNLASNAGFFQDLGGIDSVLNALRTLNRPPSAWYTPDIQPIG